MIAVRTERLYVEESLAGTVQRLVVSPAVGQVVEDETIAMLTMFTALD